jgi:hypothetical protein
MLSMARLSEIATSRGVMVVSVSTITLAAGFLAGFHYAKTSLEEEYAAKADEEVLAAKNAYRKLYKVDEWDSPESAAKALGLATDLVTINEAADALRAYRGHVEPITVQEGVDPVTEDGDVRVVKAEPVFEGGRDLQAARDGVVIVRNLFEETKSHVKPTPPEFEYADEVRNRTEEAPYVISYEEYMTGEELFRQVTLTYYAEDGILTDDRDDVIVDVDETVGDDNLLLFGHRSNDKNVVYIRNHVLEMDIELVRSFGSYAVEVAGITKE